MTYFRRVYHPFLLKQPSLHITATGCFMLWTHRQPDCAQAPADSNTVLGAAVVIPSLADLAEAVSALQAFINQQGLPASLGPLPVESGIVSSSFVLGKMKPWATGPWHYSPEG